MQEKVLGARWSVAVTRWMTDAVVVMELLMKLVDALKGGLHKAI